MNITETPSSHPIPKFPTYGDHYRSLSRQSFKDANKAFELARSHGRMAAAAGASK